MRFLDKSDKYLYMFIFIFYFASIILIGVCLGFSIETNKIISERLDNVEKSINNINYEIISIKNTVSDTNARIDEINDTLIDKINTEINNHIVEIKVEEEDVINTASDGVLTAYKGINYYGNQKETYYNLPMDGVISIAKSQGIEGEYWVREDGCKMYGDYIIVAANLDIYPRGSLVETSLGTGIVLDTGGFAASNPNQVDIATDW